MTTRLQNTIIATAVAFAASAAVPAFADELQLPSHPKSGECGYQDLVGQNLQSLTDEFQQITDAGFSIRVIEPGQPVTSDYSWDRINFKVDAAGTVLAVTCH